MFFTPYMVFSSLESLQGELDSTGFIVAFETTLLRHGLVKIHCLLRMLNTTQW